MTNSEFDKKLSDIVSEETIDFNEDNWASMQQMLDGRGNKRSLLAVIPLLVKPYAAAAGIVIMITSVWYYVQPGKPSVAMNTLQDAGGQAEYSTGKNNVVPVPDTDTNRIVYGTVAPNLMVERHEDDTNVLTTATMDTGTIAVSTEMPKPVFNFNHPDANNRRAGTVYPDVYEPAKIRKISFGVNSGMAIYKNRSSFAAGIMMNNRIGKRLSVQTGVVYVNGRQEYTVKHVTITETQVITPAGTSNEPHIERTITESYTQQSKSLPYVQVNPNVSVQLFDKLYAMAGMDMQRVVTDKNALNTINRHLADAGKKVAETDFGATFNVNYMLTPNISLGLMYRNTLLDKSSDGKEYIKRNYFLMQLQYQFYR